MVSKGVILENNKPRLKEVIKILEKTDKRTESEIDKIVSMLEWMPFFKTVRPMTREGLLEIAQSVSYQFCEPGETIFKQGDLPESYYVILKGRIQASIPDPKGDGIIEPKNLDAEEICEDSEMP